MGFALLPSLLLSAVAGCTSVPLQPDNTLTSYDGLTKVDGRIRKAEYKAVPADLNVSRTVYIEPTLVSPTAAQASIKVTDQALVATVVSRALCVGVSDRFTVTDDRESADLVVHATVTRIVPTNATVAGLSTAASIGASFAASSVPVPRIPLGLGGLAVEAEATTRDGKQAAAMVWSKGANFVTTGARMSQIGDAYSLAESFGSDFSKMLVTGKTPFKFGLPKLPSYQKLKSGLGGKPKYQACERFGRAPGLKDFAGSQLGLPPSWTDKPVRPQSQ
ncbi:MAG: DUF3313 domain-containing protein [Mesorhizobium sp.]|nr:DUF3313 domain-containing protein [Mesorhizobium sp. M5C.F.Cr.IN.023.01.1.1]RWF88300.1 MAG: DUF3313 domain-containing protein [Mesorhizobium sp.]RWF93157.1 MAG: DUF3313 domain-containing protein [Mesorhizobium sp.]RWI42758.1 MAG: DUF3313 domain-containing protein [Mesorhizobium sp.]RWI54033.1 MAG: DUF3313 domain-containing protein [Mesorhizobium sp.]